jgi:hypothetical protein
MLQEAERLWRHLEPYWPTPSVAALANDESDALAGIARQAGENRWNLARDRARRELDAELLRVAVQVLARDEGTREERSRSVRTLQERAIELNCVDIRDGTDALLSILEAEAALFTGARAALGRRTHPLQVETVSRRFGAGPIVSMTETAIGVRRADGKSESIPLTRLTARERFELLNVLQDQRAGLACLAMAAICLRAGLLEQARTELWTAEATTGITVPATLLRRAMEEATR